MNFVKNHVVLVGSGVCALFALIGGFPLVFFLLACINTVAGNGDGLGTVMTPWLIFCAVVSLIPMVLTGALERVLRLASNTFTVIYNLVPFWVVDFTLAITGWLVVLLAAAVVPFAFMIPDLLAEFRFCSLDKRFEDRG